jgi:hypothetical protein
MSGMKLISLVIILIIYFLPKSFAQRLTDQDQYELERSVKTTQFFLDQTDLSPNQYINNCKVGGGVCVSANVLSFFGITGGIECLQGEKVDFTDLFSYKGLELDCYCSGGAGGSAKVNTLAGASVGAVGIKTFGHCEKVSDYEGGFLTVGLEGSVKMPPSSPIPEASLSFNLSTGINLAAMNDSVIKIKGPDPKNKNTARLRLISQFKALSKTLIQNPNTFGKVALIPLMTIASTMLANEPQILSEFIYAITAGSKDAGLAKGLIETQLSRSKDALDIFQRPLEKILKEIESPQTSTFKNSFISQSKKECLLLFPAEKEKCSQTQPTELTTFFKNMLYQDGIVDAKKLGKGFLGTCHAVSMTGEIGKSISTGIPGLKISPTYSYTNYAHIAKLKISLSSSIIPGSDWLHGLVTDVAHSCRLIDDESYNSIKKLLKSRESTIRGDLAKACADAALEGVNGPIRIAQSLFSEDKPYEFDQQKYNNDFMKDRYIAVADNTRTNIDQKARIQDEAFKKYLLKEKLRKQQLKNFYYRYKKPQ